MISRIKDIYHSKEDSTDLCVDDHKMLGISLSCPSFSSIHPRAHQVSLSPPKSATPQPKILNEIKEDTDIISAASILICMGSCSNIRQHQQYHFKQNNQNKLSDDVICQYDNDHDKENQNQYSHIYHPQRQRLPTLALPEDRTKLNSLHCFVRQTLLEIYVLDDKHRKYKKHKRALIHRKDEDYDQEKQRSSSENNNPLLSAPNHHNAENKPSPQQNNANAPSPSPIIRVGIRCSFCASIPRKQRCNMSTVHPKNLSDLYRSVCTWQRIHFHQCCWIPHDVRELYWKLKREDKTRGKTTYWVESAKRVGLMDCPDGRGLCLVSKCDVERKIE
mmetsp:Transcript_16413/g.20485  ORF Transcript_16413/g.20485 Transcript_16413/m.20485 type:complete len:332 (+) Transcript_16413:103-1098(+)